MREKYEYKEMEISLGSIANNPNFTDEERNWADELWTTLKNSDKPKPHEKLSIEILDILEKNAGYKIDYQIKESILCLFDILAKQQQESI